MDTVILSRMYHLVIENILSKFTRYIYHLFSILLISNRIITSIANILPAALDDDEAKCTLASTNLPFTLWFRASDLAVFVFAALAVVGKSVVRLRGVRKKDYSDISLLIRCVFLACLSILGIVFTVTDIASPYITSTSTTSTKD
jgi:hypothetical protein